MEETKQGNLLISIFKLHFEIIVSYYLFRDSRAKLDATMDKLFVLFGVEILKIVPGRVSTEVDAR